MNKTNAPPKPHPRPRKYFPALSGATLCLGFILPGAGCGSPPSVVPVLEVVQRALLDEAQRVAEADAAHDRLYLQQARRQIWDGFRADLNTTDTLTPGWIEDATVGFVQAREALLRQEFDLARQREFRQDNLRDAAAAQARAIAILQQQDRLFHDAVGLGPRSSSPPPSETSR